MSASRWFASGAREVGTGGQSLETSAARRTYSKGACTRRGSHGRPEHACLTAPSHASARSPPVAALPASQRQPRGSRAPFVAGAQVGARGRRGRTWRARCDDGRGAGADARDARRARRRAGGSSRATRSTSRARSRPRGSRARSTSSTSTRRSGRRRRTCTRRGSTGRPTGASCARRRTTTAGASRSASYLDMLAPRLEALAQLLAPAGRSGCTSTGARRTSCASLLDEILGREAFVNEIVWRRAPNLGRQAASHQFGRTLDTLVVYGRPSARSSSRRRASSPSSRRRCARDAEGRPFTTRAARRLHRRVDRAPRAGGPRAPDGERARST